MPAPSLPQELIDAIVDLLRGERHALAASSLVCGAWRDAAQHHLLSKIFCPARAIRALCAQLEAEDDPLRVFGSHVREIWVYGTTSEPTQTFDVRMMARFLATLPNLRSLHLSRVSLAVDTEEDVGTVEDLPRWRYRLRQLELPMLEEKDAQQVVEIVGLFAEVKKLTLKYTSDMSESADIEERSRRTCPSDEIFEPQDAAEDGVDGGGEENLTRCERLIIHGDHTSSFEVRRVLRLDLLKSLEVMSLFTRNVPSILEILAAAANSLQSLTLHPYQEYLSGTRFYNWEAFNAFPSVEIEHFSLILTMKSVSGLASLSPVCRLLSHFPHTVTSVALTLDESRRAIQPLYTLGWEVLEGRLMRFDRLESITLDRFPYQPRGKEIILHAAKIGMPTLVARGLLR